jgi:hypothetical protein
MRAIVFTSIVAVLMICAGDASASSAKKQHLDATGGNVGDHQIVYITATTAKNSANGTALVVLKKSGKQELAYGYYFADSKGVVGMVDEERVAKTSASDNANLVITTVEVTKAQYVATKRIILKESKIKSDIDGPTILFYNCIRKVLLACDMKIPYRSAYRAPNPAQWVGDIPAYSRDRVIKDPAD